MVLWVHNPPGIGFDAHIELSRYLAGKEPCVMVDDVFPRIYFKRNLQEQMSVNKTYSDFFVSRGCNLTFSSEIYKGSSLNNLPEIGKTRSLSTADELGVKIGDVVTWKLKK